MSVKKHNIILMFSLAFVLYSRAQSPANPTISPQPTANVSPCYNIGFQSLPVGSYSALPGWTLGAGTYTNFNTNGYCTNFPITSSLSPGVGIVNTPMAFSTPSLIPLSPFFGSQVMLLNGSSGNGNFVRAEKTFSVSASNKFLEYAYMFFTSHNVESCCDAAYLKIILLDNSNNAIPCGSVAIVGTNGSYSSCINPTSVPTVTSASGQYSPSWIINNYDLTPYIGTTVKIKIETGRCTAGGHYSLVWFDARCNGSSLISTNGTVNGNTITVCNTNSLASLTNLAASSCTWNGPPTSTISNNNSATISTSVSGVYSLSIYNPNCGGTSTFTYMVNFCITTFINENSNDKKVMVYPNPSSGAITIKGIKEMELQIKDISGREIDRFSLSGSTNYTYRKEGLPKGIYFISGEGIREKIVVCGE
jgi:hypothetical protein